MNYDCRNSLKQFNCNTTGMAVHTYQWRRRVKRKLEGDLEHIEASTLAEAETDIGNELNALREALRSQHQAIEQLQSELEEERNASASAADETLAMILRLQKEKAEAQMEASQFKRFAEQKLAHDQQELLSLENLLYRKDQAIKALEFELLSFKHRMLSLGFDEFEDGNIRSPERSGLNDREGCFSTSEYSNRRINSNTETVDSLDFWDGQTRDFVHSDAKEAKSGRICLDKWSDAASSSRPQHAQGDAFFSEILPGHGFDCDPSNLLFSDDCFCLNEAKYLNLNGRHGCNKSDVDEAENIAVDAIEKSLADDNLTLWECVEKLFQRVQQLEKGTHNDQLDIEWVATRKVLQRNLAAYSASLRDGSNKSFRRLSSKGEADEESSGGSDGLSVPNVNSSSLGENVTECENERDRKSGMSDLFEERDSSSQRHGSHNLTKKVLETKPVPSSEEGSKSCQRLSAEDEVVSDSLMVKEIVEETDKLDMVGMLTPKGSISINASFTQPMDDENNRKSSRSDVSDQENRTTRSIRCNSLKGNGAYNTVVSKEVMSVHFDGDIYTAGHVVDSHPVELKPETEYDSVQAEVKQLIHRIQSLEEERDSMRQAIQYLKRQNSRLTQLNKMAPEGYEGQTPDKIDSVTRRLPPPEGSSFFSIIKWILSYILRINVWRCQSRHMHGIPLHSVGLLLLLDKTPKRRQGTFITRVASKGIPSIFAS